LSLSPAPCLVNAFRSRTTTWTRPSSNQTANAAEQRAEADASRENHSRRILADDLLDAGAARTANGSTILPVEMSRLEALVHYPLDGRKGLHQRDGHITSPTSVGPPPGSTPSTANHPSTCPNGNHLTVQPQPVSQLGPLPFRLGNEIDFDRSSLFCRSQ